MQFVSLARRFRNAFSGIAVAIREEQSFQIQLSVAGIVLILALALRLNATAFALLVTIIAAVLAFELMNSALERLADALIPEAHPGVRHAKDLAAGAVLVVALASIVLALLLFF